MTRRTKIVATLGPACDARRARGAAAGRRRRGAPQPEPRPARRAPRTGWRTCARSAARVGRPIGVLADLPGPKIRAGAFPDGGVDLAPGSRRALVPGHGAEHRRPSSPSTTRRCSTTSIPATGSCSATAASRCASTRSPTPRWSAEVESGGRTQGRPGVHLPCERLRLFTPTAEDLELAEAVAAAGVDFVGAVVRAPGRRRRRAAGGGRRPGRHRRQDRDRSALADLAGDRRRGRRRDGRPRRPRHRLPAGGRAAPAEADHPPLRRGRDAGDHGDADARVDDRRPVADAGRGERRRQRRVRRHRRRDAVGRDGDRPRPGRGRDDDGAASPRAPRPRPATGSGPSGSGPEQRDVGRTTRRERITAAITHAAWQAAHDAGASAILCCTRSGRTARAMARFRPAPAWSGCRPTRARSNALTLSWGVESVHVDKYRSTDEMVWFAVETAVHARARRHGDIVLVLAGAPDRRSGGGDRRAAHRAGRVTTVDGSGRRSRARRRAAASCSSTARWTARPGCSSCPAPRRAATACCATTGAATAARARTRARSRWTARSTISSTLLDGRRGGRVRSQLRRQRRARPRPTGDRSWSGRSSSTRRRCRGSMVAGDDGRRSRAGDERRPGRCRRAVHAPADRRRAVGAAAARHARGAPRRGRGDGGRAGRPARRTRRGIRRTSACRWSRCTAPTGPPHHRRSTEHLGAVLADCRGVDVEGARHFGPNTHPDAVAAAIGRAGQPNGRGDRDGAAEERARRVIDGVVGERGAHPSAQSWSVVALRPDDEREHAQQRRWPATLRRGSS